MSAPQVEAHLQYAEGQLDIDLTAQLEAPVPRYSATLRLDHLNMAHVLAGEQGTLRPISGYRAQASLSHSGALRQSCVWRRAV